MTDPARVAAALLATKLTRGRLVSPFTAREVYRNEWTGLTEARVVQGALECLEDLGWIWPEAQPSSRRRSRCGMLPAASTTAHSSARWRSDVTRTAVPARSSICQP